MTPTSAKPTPKVAAASLGGAASIVVVFVLTSLGVDVPGEVGSALATLFAAAAGYLTPDA